MLDNKMAYVKGAGLSKNAKKKLKRIAAALRMNESEALRRLIADDAAAVRRKEKTYRMMRDSGTKTKTCCFRFGEEDMKNLTVLCNYYGTGTEDVIRHLILEYYTANLEK